MAQARVLADRMIPGEGLMWDALRIAAANLLLVLCARVAIPLPWTPVPITGQTFGVMLIAVLLGPTRAAVAISLYLLEGFAGLPVFQPFGPPGPARFIGPTAGYLLAYPFAAAVSGWLVAKRVFGNAYARVLPLVASLVCGESVVFLGGCTWLAVGMHLGWGAAFASGVAPFLPGDAVKIAAVVAVVRSLHLVTPDEVPDVQ